MNFQYVLQFTDAYLSSLLSNLSVIYFRHLFKEKFNFVLRTFVAEAISNILKSIDLHGRQHQTYIVGSGVTAKGAKKLAKMLACMTIGDLDALLHLKNIDPAKVAQLLADIQDLAKALVMFIQI